MLQSKGQNIFRFKNLIIAPYCLYLHNKTVCLWRISVFLRTHFKYLEKALAFVLGY